MILSLLVSSTCSHHYYLHVDAGSKQLQFKITHISNKVVFFPRLTFIILRNTLNMQRT